MPLNFSLQDISWSVLSQVTQMLISIYVGDSKSVPKSVPKVISLTCQH
jgi:hypothetical protein